MSVEFSMSEFLRNGRIGPLQTGYPRIALIDLLGPPDDVSVKGLPTIFKYGNIQFTFAVDKLSVIAISLSRNHLRWHSAFVLSGLVPTPAMLFADFVRVFAKDFDAIAENASLSFDSQRVIILQPSGVEVLFLDEQLDKMYKAALPK